MLKEFRKFALRGSVVDLAVGIVIGAAFSAVVNSLVNDILTPPIGWLLGGVDFENSYLTLQTGTPTGPYASLEAAQTAGAVTLNYGLFINAILSFLIVALALFFLIRAVNRLQSMAETPSEPAPTTKDCPFCLTSIPLQASRCPACTSQLEKA